MLSDKKAVLFEGSTLWRKEMEDLVFIKIEDAIGKFCFWL